MTIRQAKDDDLEAIIQLANEIAVLHHRYEPEIFLPPGDSDRGAPFWRKCIVKPGSAVLINEDGNGINAFVTARVAEHNELSFLVQSKICRIGTLIVSEAYRGNGIGRGLMGMAEQWAKD